MATSPSPQQKRRGLFKGLFFRIVAIALGLSPLLAVEIGLWAIDAGRPTDYSDPFVGFSRIHPLFVRNEQSGRYEIPKSRQTHFCPESFRSVKSPKEFRVFILGGSTVQGRPFEIATSFSTWLELNLNAANSSRRFEVVNCGGVSYATYRLVPILEEVLRYDPDLIIFCEGHNEFLEDRSYGHLKSTPVSVSYVHQQISSLRSYTLLRDAALHITGKQAEPISSNRPVLGPEADAMLDWKNGMAGYRRNPKWQADVIAHFAYNLRRIAAIADRKGVPLLIVSPVANLQFAPFKSEHRAGMTAVACEQYERLLQQAGEEFRNDPASALAILGQAVDLDDQHALVHYEMGLCYLELGRREEAKAAFIRAKDLDICPLRILEPMRALITEIAEETETPLVDADAVIAANSRSGFPDRQWMVDHVHPGVEGHQLIAEAILEKLVELNMVRPTTGWQAERDRAYRDHLANLHPAYFERGQRRLRAEQRWAHGRTKRERSSNEFPADIAGQGASR